MPHGQDLETSEKAFSQYECLQCGRIVESKSHPGDCSECGGNFQDRAKSLE